MSKLPFFLCLSTAVLSAQQTQGWVAYSATYSDTLNDTDGFGRLLSSEEKVGEEIRASDGSLLTTVTVNGEPATGRLWQACGQMINLAYTRKHATILATVPRRHPNLPPDAPLGSMTIGGLEFTAYPVHSNIGTGTIWINMKEDITGKFEMHVDLPNGVHRETVHQLTSLDVSSPVDPSRMKIPSHFTLTKGKPSEACLSFTPGS